jgi:DNA gyrase subunit A
MEKENFITEIDLLDESKDCFLTYASEVLTDRAIPSVEDGLLSAQRKILWTMEDFLKMDSKSKTKKCNSIVGSTLSTSYFHGDASCYGVLCKMAQEFLMRYPLITGQGSLGTQESNDMVASSRYTEAKPSKYADLMMNDFKKKVVPEKGTYNGEYMEPVVLPSSFPNALCNGRQAIGISMAHNSAPHNLTEVCNAAIHFIEKQGNITLDELMQDIPGPDFPLGGTIINQKDVRTAYGTGKSSTSLKIRGDYEIKGKEIIFTTIPYRTYRNKIKEQIAENIDELESVIVDFEDESSVGENRLVFTAKDTASVGTALNKLFALTDLQTTLSFNMNFIVNGTPQLCNLYTLIKCYVEHQENVLLAATAYDKAKVEHRLHILDGLIAAIDQIDKVIALIRASESKGDARLGLMKLLNVDEVQADAILDMKLAKLTRIDKNELVQEKKEKEELLKEYNKIIDDKSYRDSILIKQITNLKTNFGDARRTKLLNVETASKEEKEIEFVEPEQCVVIMSEGGLIKRVPSSSFKVQKRNGKGVKTQDDIVNAVIRTNTVDSLMIFTNKGKMYRLLVNDIPAGTNASKGTPVSTLIEMESGEEPSTIYSIYRDTEAKFVLFITKKGVVKKTSLEEYIKTKKKNGILAITLKEGDELAAVSLIKDEDLILITENGMGIKFNSMEVSATSRATTGVKGIAMDEEDKVIAALAVRNTEDKLAIFSTNGLGKKVSLNELPVQKRAGKGLMCYKPTESTGKLAAAALISDEDNILVIGNKKSICISAAEVPELGRPSIGNQIIKEEKIVAVNKI